MISRMFSWYRRQQYQRRLQRYEAALTIMMDEEFPLVDLPEVLAQFWREVDLDDFKRITPHMAMNAHLKTYCKNITRLVMLIHDANLWIGEEADVRLETLIQNLTKTQHKLTLDAFLSDDHDRPIDIRHYLVRLKGVLLHNHIIQETQTNQFYRRLLEPAYIDVRRFTRCVVDTLIKEEYT